ncbi:autotransporter outer membrane beta-barrel domain-containing protein [Nitrincola iocasae]|uniref:Autotransporter outer membrane beta-barrel domain-containing protein n=2 Tax=Nitrincola iocasae TaxID=2614693 RepID=A0A5J6LJD2_9GAMM|nr:autotransporter outer membrane beta-barrel domain-containing protein [Nitrincola iocasae]
MEIDGPTPGTEYDQINVSGTATLDGTLDLQFSHAPIAGTKYNLINAGSLVLAGDPQNGFNPIIDNISNNLGATLQLTPVITGTEYGMLIEQLSFEAVVSELLTPNQQSLALNLDSFATSDQAVDLFDALNMLPAEQLPDAYGSLSGEQHTHTLPQVARASHQFTRVIGEQLAYSGDDVASLLDTSKPSRTVWLRGISGLGDIDSDGKASKAKHKSHGIVLGYDSEMQDGLVAGVAFGYTRSNVNMHAGGSGIDSYQLAAYSRKQWTDNYLNTIFGIGHHSVNSTREVQFTGFSGAAKSEYNIDALGLSLEAGRHYTLSDNHWVTPFAGLEYGHYRQKGFTETGAGDASLTYGDDRMNSLRSVLGARMNSELKSSNGMQFNTTLGLSWVHEHLYREASLNPAFAANGDVSFNIKGPATDRNRAQTLLGVSTYLSKYSQLDLEYRGEFADSDRQHAIAATFRMRW